MGQFLFQGDDVFKTIDTLSGGQRSRIALARLTLQGANFLLLDEPTNHLDLDSQEILQDALQQFSGTVLLVTHDRALVDAIATRLWMLEPGEGHEPSQLIEFKGTWRQWQQERLAQSQAPDLAAADLDDLTDAQAHRERQRDDRRQRQLSDKRAAEASEVEERVHRMEQRLAQLEEQMSTASRIHDLAGHVRGGGGRGFGGGGFHRSGRRFDGSRGFCSRGGCRGRTGSQDQSHDHQYGKQG